MNKRVCAFTLFWLLVLTAQAISAAPANFAGTWTLDKAKSESLPRFWENVDSVTLVITQDAQQITVETKLSGGGGQGIPSQALTYKLDGSQTMAEMGGRMPGKATLKAKWIDDSKLELNTVRNVNFQGNDVTITTKEQWQLTDRGKVLKIHRTSESPRGTQESKPSFNRK